MHGAKGDDERLNRWHRFLLRFGLARDPRGEGRAVDPGREDRVLDPPVETGERD